MTWSSRSTFGWQSELNHQNAWVSDGQCLAYSDLFLMERVDPGAFAPSRFDKLNKAGMLLQSSSQGSRIQCPESVGSIIIFVYIQHLYLLPDLLRPLPICCKVWSHPRLGQPEHRASARVTSPSSLKSPAWSSCFLSKIPCKCEVLLSSSVLWTVFPGQGESEVDLLYLACYRLAPLYDKSSTLPGWKWGGIAPPFSYKPEWRRGCLIFW